MRKKVWRELLILVLALMLLPGTLGAIGIGEELTQVIEEELGFAGKAQLTLINGVGAVEITGWDEQKIALHAVLRARTPEELAEVGVGSIILVGFSPSDVVRESHFLGESVEITVGSGENRLGLNVGAGSIKLELLGGAEG